MNKAQRQLRDGKESFLSRRSMLHRTTALAAIALTGSALCSSTEVSGADGEAPTGRDPEPVNAFRGVLDAMVKFPVVAIGERHLMQEWHDFVTALFFHPDLPGKISDVVVEFGNAQHQAVADRFILQDEPVANAELEQIWRHTIGGGVLWDAPVYAQFFRTVRAVNWMQPAAKRIRVLLGDPAFDYHKVQSPADKGYLTKVAVDRDPYFAAVVEREVLAKGRRALLLAGAGHLLRNVKDDHTGKPNAASLLDEKHPGQVFVICPVTPSSRVPQGAEPRGPEQALVNWPRPSLTALAGTSLGAQRGPMAHRALTPTRNRFCDQADAGLYLGPAEVLTKSCPEPALYQGGSYAEELKRQNELAAKLKIRQQDGLKNALAGPQYFEK